MEGKSSLYERQWSEAHAIQAIYPEEYEDIRPAWNVAVYPPHFVVHLKTDAGIALDVSIQLVGRYPLDVPIISLTRKRGLLAAQVNDLYASMGELAKGCVGREMIFDLIEHAKEALLAFGQKKVSFHDRMLMDRQQRAMLAEEEAEAGKKLVMDLESKIKEEFEKKQLQMTTGEIVENEPVKPENEFIFDPELVFYEPGLDIAKYIDKVKILKSLGSIKYDSEVTAEVFEVSFGENILLMRKFNLEEYANIEPEKFGRKIESFLKRVNDVGLLTHNPYVVRIIGAQYLDFELFVLSEKTDSKPLLQSNVPTKLPDLKVIFKQLAVGLNHIHQSNYVHKDLRLSTLYLDEAHVSIQIGDIHFHHELHVLLHREDFPTPPTWLPSELKEKGTVSRKTDVWFLGIIYIQLLYGFDVTDRYLNWNSVKTNFNPNPQLANLFDGIFQSSPNYRFTTTDILKNDFFEETAGHVSMGDTTTMGGRRSVPVTPGKMINSRFETDFEQLEVLGKGGFGEVVKARNRVDNRFYAIKTINLDPENVDYNRKILREVMTLSRLQHDRVVRYYQAWIEGSSHQQPNIPPQPDHPDYSDFSESEDAIDEEYVNTSRDWLGDSLLDKNVFNENLSMEVSLMKHLNRTGFSESDESMATSSSDILLTDNTERPLEYQTLFIQMEYCPKRTLRNLIDEGIEPEEIWRLFRQIVEGLAYIHSQGMIHRDLKPSNIFMDSQGNVKIGDFGLATTTTTSYSSGRKTKQSFEHSSSINESLTAGIGTPFYTSPEQEQPKARYNNKVDMYSLGIILLEMWCHFDTSMERAESLRKARLDPIVLPKYFCSDELSKQRSLLLNLISPDPKKRLSSSDLLLSDLLPVRIENEQVNNVLRSATNPVNPAFSNLIEMLFKNSPDSLKDFAYDFNSNNVYEIDVLVRMAVVRQRMTRVFAEHGALDTSVPLFQLSTGYNPDSVCVLDGTGQRLDLPYDLTRPFARFVARNNISDYRRFAFERIFRLPVLPGGQPRQPVECDFDIIFSHGEGLIEEAEVLKVTLDAITATCDCGIQQLTIILGNVHLAKLLAQALSIDESAFVDCLQGSQHFGTQKRLNILSSKFPSLPIDKISKLMQSDPKGRTQALISILGKFGRLAQPIIAHLVALHDILRGPLDMKQCTVVIEPLFVHNPALYYTGLVFEVLLHASHSKKKRAIEVLAAGGRYDQLISSYKYPSAYGTFTGAIGVAFSINKLAGLLPSDPVHPNKIFLWPSTDEVLIDELVSIASLLWSAGLPCKIAHRSELDKIESITTVARQHGVKHIVILSGKRSAACKLRDVEKLIDMEMPRSNLVQYLQRSYNIGPTAIQPPTEEMNVVLLGNLGTKLHGTQRAIVTEKAIRAVSCLHIPLPLTLVIHDVNRELIRKVFDLIDERKIIDAFGNVERENIERLNTVRDKARDALESIVCFYSNRENAVDVMVVR